ncbi:MAG: phosphotransferase family protein [Bacillota bacterium]|jgi:aminoglycoside phosphotransferase (APT) family kinase protein|nr:phosphotransferase family protein [Bacillota bacterium]
MNVVNDRATSIRSGEELDAKKVLDFLRDSVPGLKGEVEIKQFPSGFSNLTYLVKVGEREMVLRRPPFGRKAKTAHDMGREYRVLSSLKPVFPYCPQPLVYTEDEAVMGCPFYVMERIPGVILRRDLPKGMELSPQEARTLSENLIKVQCQLHTVDYVQAGLGDFGRPEGYVRRQVEGWSKRYRDARTPDAPDFEKVMQWLYDKMPGESGIVGIIHNDFKFDNAVLDPSNPTEIIGILDWEMATLGDPLMDLGSSLGYWVEKDDPEMMQAIRQMPTHLEGMLTRKEQFALYSELRGIKTDNFDFYYCFGLFRLAVIAQQIYYRFYHGQTKDERFGMLIAAIRVLEATALQVIEKSDL